jgi:hypothetical protein
MTVAECSDMAKKTPATIRRWHKTGVFKGFFHPERPKELIFHRENFEHWLKTRRNGIVDPNDPKKPKRITWI